MTKPTPEQIDAAKREIEAENKAPLERFAENNRRSQLPSEDPDHIHGMLCDGQDGWSSYCERLRRKLFG